MKSIDLNQRSWQWAILLFLAFLWGSSFILMKRSLVVFSPVQVASLRMSIAGIVLLPFAIKNIKFLKTRFWSLLIVGLIGNGIPAYLFTWSQMHVSSSSAGILNSLTPLFTLIVGGLFFRTQIRILQVTGVIIGLAGSVFLFLTKGFVFDWAILSWGSLIVIATAMYGVNINHVKKKLADIPGIIIAAQAFFLIMPFTIFIFFTTDIDISVTKNPAFPMALFAVVTLGMLGSALAVALMNMLIKYTSAVFASSVTYIMPVVALLWGFGDGEILTIFTFLSLLLILFGVYIVQFGKSK
ncbi:MAG: hypothetical protein CVU05_15510 [Bacteroidetes bacterium HGW-Bacteroidetes-21]|nr:MAG: hypothetical protein CVU05_15510 [Bacteroidetes bacterium HGW-Bacteroidetes-21]